MTDAERKITMDSSGFVVLADMVPAIVQEIRYYSTYNFIGDRINGYEEPCALITKQAARALLSVSKSDRWTFSTWHMTSSLSFLGVDIALHHLPTAIADTPIFLAN